MVFRDSRQTARHGIDAARAALVLVDVDLAHRWPGVVMRIQPQPQHQALPVGLVPVVELGTGMQGGEIVEEARLAGFEAGLELELVRCRAEGVERVDLFRRVVDAEIAHGDGRDLADVEDADIAVDVGENRDVVGRDLRMTGGLFAAAMIAEAAIVERHQVGTARQQLVVDREAGSVLAEAAGARLAHAHQADDLAEIGVELKLAAREIAAGAFGLPL